MRDDQIAQLKAALRPFGEEAIQPGDIELLRLIKQVMTSSGLVRVERLSGPLPENFHGTIHDESVLVSFPAYSAAIELQTLLGEMLAHDAAPPLAVQEADGTPSGTVSTIIWPNGSLAVDDDSDTATVTFSAITELDDIPDVNAPSPSDGDLLAWDATPGEWVNVPAPSSSYTDEQVRDVIGAALVAGNNIDITVNDGADTITIDVEALTSTDIGDFNEAAQDAVGTILADTASINFTYTDATPEIKADAIFGTTSGTVAEGNHTHAGGYTDEQAQDAVGTILTDSSSIDFTYNDGANTITAAVIDEYIEDLIGGMLTDGAGIDFTYNDGANQITAEPIFAGTGSAGTVAHSDHSHTASSVPAMTSGIDLAKWVTGGTNYYARIDMVGALDLSTTGNALTADTMQAGLFPVVADSLGNLPSFDQVAINVTNLIALSTIRLGVYAMGTDGKPGALIADWGTVSSASTGDKTLSISWSPTAGQYYLVMVSTHAPSVLRQATGRHAPIGHTSVATLAQGTDYTRNVAGSSAALPNPFGTAVTVTNHRPIWLRVA